MKIFIPIKENSQRVKRKNFRKINNNSLYNHMLYKLSNFEVYVDTDSDEIFQDINKNEKLNNVTVFKRAPDLIGDKVSVCDLIKNFIEKFNFYDNLIFQTHVTSPFLTNEIILDSKNCMQGNIDSVVSCNVINSRFWRKENYGFVPVNHNPLKLEQTQDLPNYYEENSVFYIFKGSNFIKNKSRIGMFPYFFPLDFPFNVDIDTESDWNLVESITK